MTRSSAASDVVAADKSGHCCDGMLVTSSRGPLAVLLHYQRLHNVLQVWASFAYKSRSSCIQSFKHILPYRFVTMGLTSSLYVMWVVTQKAASSASDPHCITFACNRPARCSNLDATSAGAKA